MNLLQSELERIIEIEDDKLAKSIAGFLSVKDPRNSNRYVRAYISRKIQ